MKLATIALPLLLALIVPTVACQGAYYKTMEKFGKHKREILVDRVEAARDEQTEAKEEFKDALTRFKELTGFKGGELERKYEALKSEYEDCESRAEAVSERIASIEDVGQAMFDEWREELGQYTNKDLRRSSERQLRDTKQRYGELIGAMKKVEQAMEPVLATFKDQVLYLKHNLNAQAISSLQGQSASIEADVARLIADMECSIDAATEFIEALPKS
jgi:chromosome segregation ATPase